MVLDFHHVPGRLRVRLAALKANRQAAIPLQAEVLALGGVQSASINSATGSLIVHYDQNRFALEALWATLRRLDYVEQLRETLDPASPQNLADAQTERRERLPPAVDSRFQRQLVDGVSRLRAPEEPDMDRFNAIDHPVQRLAPISGRQGRGSDLYPRVSEVAEELVSAAASAVTEALIDALLERLLGRSATKLLQALV